MRTKLLVSPAITYRKIKYTVTPPVTQKAQTKKIPPGHSKPQSQSQIRLLCCNIQRLNTAKQHNKLLAILDKDCDINILVDAGITDRGSNRIKNQSMHLMGNYVLHTTNTSLRGIFIMIKKSLGAKMENIQQLDDSTLIFDLVNSDNKRLTIATVYAPSDVDNPQYFETVDNCLQDRVETSDYQILIGDYNTTLDYNRDRLNYSKINDNHKKCRELLNNWFSQEKWVDIYDYKNPGKKSYTWESKTAPGKKGRIDHCLVSPNLVKHTQYVKHVSIGSHLTDHRAIELCLDWAMAKKGKGIFRAKQGLEKDPKYKQIIQRLIQRCLVDTLPDNDAREYLNGKLDNLDKHYENLERLDNEICIANKKIKATNVNNENLDI